VTNREYREFMDDGGYRRADLWLSAGWNTVNQESWQAPLYWIQRDGQWWNHTLSGLRTIDDDEPVCHVSYFEADAFARWAGARLATEAEWELAAGAVPVVGNFAESDRFHPAPVATAHGFCGTGFQPVSCDQDTGWKPVPRQTSSPLTEGDLASGSNQPIEQMFGDVWEWTASAYLAYPDYRPAAGALGEYNGKFMCNQFVLRGGSCATPKTHIRPTYRNFFPPDARWQFSGIRLARSV
jgi:ergothioneine biosynthesis protein EgtB